MNSFTRTLTAAISAGIATIVVQEKLRFHPAMQRINFTGETVSLAEGAALSSGLIVGNLALGNYGSALSLAATGIAGAYDDLDQGKHDGKQIAKGLRGHFQALRNGHLSSGAMKVAVIGTCAAGYALRKAQQKQGKPAQKITEVLVDTALIAGTANLANLFDLRPGRALKVAALGSLLNTKTAGKETLTTLIPIALLAEEDLQGKTMLGDMGANPLGLIVGIQTTQIKTLALKTLICSGVVALNLVSEKISFTQIIENNSVLNHLDQLGREEKPRS